MALPNQTPEERRAALEKAAEARHARAELRDKIKTGKISVKEVLTTEGNPVIDKLRVKDMIASLPGYGKAKVTKVMEELGISETRRIKGLGTRQREALIEKLSK
ncbi:MAG: integration host factor, actinobacterial type [Coriobacteriales bacterium]|jgi:hypothetical protein